MNGCITYAIFYQIITSIIYIVAVALIALFIKRSCTKSRRICFCECSSKYQCILEFVTYFYIIISLLIPVEDTIYMKQQCQELEEQDNQNKNNARNIIEEISAFCFVIQILMIPTLTFMKAHWTFINTKFAIPPFQVKLIVISNIIFWIAFLSILVLLAFNGVVHVDTTATYIGYISLSLCILDWWYGYKYFINFI